MISDETRKKWDDKINAIIESVVNLHLNNWEEEFIDSIQIRRAKGLDLTHKQSKCLNKIYERIL